MESTETTEIKTPPIKEQAIKWDYNYFREYLLGLSRGKKFLLPTKQYPTRIELSQDWHKTFDEMREETERDGHERWVLIGFRENERSIYLPKIPAKGMRDHVPGEVIVDYAEKYRRKYGIMNLVGDIHSHPPLIHRFIKLPFISAFFSAEDLYCLLVGHITAMGVVDSTSNESLFVFKTRNTRDVPPYIFNQDSFAEHWYQKVGLIPVKLFGHRDAIPTKINANLWTCNIEIAREHDLVLYVAKPNQDLVKVFPPIQ